MSFANKTLPFILITSFLIRLPGLNQSFWLDEAIHSWASTTLTFKELIINYMPGDFNPPLLYVITWIFAHAFGNSEIILRLPSLIAGVITVYATYKIAQQFNLPVKLQLWVTALVASAPLLIYYSQEARMYSLAASASAVSTWLLLRLAYAQKPSRKDYIYYWLASGAMLLSHYLAWFMLPVHVLILLINKKPYKTFIKAFAPLGFWVGLIFPMLVSQLSVGLSAAQALPVWQSLSSPSLKAIALVPIKILVGRLPVENTALHGLGIGIPLFTWAALVLYAFITELQRSSKWLLFTKSWQKTIKSMPRKSQDLIIPTLWLLLPIAIGIVVSLKAAVFSYFRFLYIVPAFYLLLTISVKKLSNHYQSAILAGFLLLNLLASGLYLFNPNYHREDWRSVQAQIDSSDKSIPVVIISAVNRPFWYYDQNKHQLLDYSEISATNNAPAIWLIKYAQPIFDPGNQTEKDLTQIYGYKTLEEMHFRGDIIIKLMINESGVQADASTDNFAKLIEIPVLKSFDEQTISY
jgi:uncharacterized membrane protein